MAIFSRANAKGTKKAAAKPKATPATEIASVEKKEKQIFIADTSVLLSPRITEKAAIGNDFGIYTFNITRSATKQQVAAAVKQLFKVTPRMVRVANVKGVRVTTRATGKKGKTASGKKAYVYLKKGEKIELA